MGAPLATRTPEVKTSRSNGSIYAEKGSKHDTDHVFLVVNFVRFLMIFRWYAYSSCT